MSSRTATKVIIAAIFLISAATAEKAYPKNLQEFAESLAHVRTRIPTTYKPRVTYSRPGVVYSRPTTVIRPGTTVVRKSCPYNCFGRGACSAGRCLCNAPYTGSDCSLVRRHMSTKPHHNFWGCAESCNKGFCFFSMCVC